MPTFGDLGERELIKLIRNTVLREGSPDSLSDDAAVINIPQGKLVACSDSLSFERHMPAGMSYEQFGWMCGAANLSDLASMGARPVGLLVSMCLPKTMDVKDICDIVSGIDQSAEFADTYVIGGDTKPGEGIVSVTALGHMEDRKPMIRNGAKVGDMIAVTGPVGGPAAGYHALKNGIDLPGSVSCLTEPIPRVEEGILLSGTGRITSCIDLSDGLATCLNTLCSESGVGAVIDWDLLPLDEGVGIMSEKLGISDEELAIGWGGEYELLFTFDRKDAEILSETGVDYHIIGLVTDEGCMLHRDEKYRVIGDGCY